MLKLICMSFDGSYQTERPEFESVADTWKYSNNLGSKWYFYPFHFVVTQSGKTIVDAPTPFQHLIGRRVKSVVKDFAVFYLTKEAKHLDAEKFARSIYN